MRKEKSKEGQEKKSLEGKGTIYSEDGVDLTLIRWMLSLTPTERLRVLQQSVRSLRRLRRGRFLG